MWIMDLIRQRKIRKNIEFRAKLKAQIESREFGDTQDPGPKFD